METIFIPAHYDGQHIILDKPYSLEPNARLLVTVLPAADAEREEWLRLSAQRLEQAYGDEEPEYPLSCVREINPNYE